MKFHLFLTVFAMVVVSFTVATAEEAKTQPAATKSITDRSKRGLYTSLVTYPYLASYAPASPYLDAPYPATTYTAASYAAAANTYTATPYAVASAPYAVASPYVLSYATYPYVAKTFSSPYAYYP